MPTLKTLVINVITCSLALLSACKKDKGNDPGNGSSILVEGKGLRKIKEVKHPSAGFFSGFGTANMMLKGNTLD